MEFRTTVNIPQAPFYIEPMERMLFVGSCFADNMGKRFQEERFQTVINPYGVMYNPASILHTVEQFFTVSPSLDSEEKKETQPFTVAVLTLGTNHVYIEKAMGKIVDNCQKRPQKLFDERELSVEECADLLRKTIRLLREKNPQINIILTLSPIRYAKYGYHESQLSKATLLLSIEHVIRETPQAPKGGVGELCYFPAYELVLDELRDYRFYQSDMLHPSPQAVDYIYERFADTFFSKATHCFIREWQPIKKALAHRPFNPDSDEYKDFIKKTQEKLRCFSEKYPNFAG
jgi:lysophospholipase L1-like esterase